MTVNLGIEGLDGKAEIPEDYSLLLGGPPGTGKSAVALEYLKEGLENGESVLYLTLRDTEGELRAAAKRRGLDPEQEGFHVLEKTDLRRSEAQGQVFEPEEVVNSLRRVFKDHSPTRVVFDSITKFLMIFESDPVKRERLRSLENRIKDHEASALYIGEVPYSMEGQLSRYEIAEFVVDAAFKLERYGEKVAFTVERLKGRGYDRAPHSLVIEDEKASLDGEVEGLKPGAENDGDQSDEVELG